MQKKLYGGENERFVQFHFSVYHGVSLWDDIKM